MNLGKAILTGALAALCMTAAAIYLNEMVDALTPKESKEWSEATNEEMHES